MKEKEVQRKNKMEVMPVLQLVITMSFPIMISMLVQSLYNIVDSIFVARISEEALSATSIAYSAQMLQIAVAVGTGVGVNSLVSRRLGAKQFDKANEAATTGLILTLLSSVVFIVWGIFGTGAFVQIFTRDQQVLDYGITYLKICQVFSTGIFLGTLTQRLLQATGRTVSSMFAQIAGAITNIILDPILIFGIAGFPGMGIAGAAIATVLGQWIAALLGLILHFIQNKEIHFVFKGFRFQKDSIMDIYKVGIPTIFMQGFGSIMVAAMNKILIAYSLSAVAFFGVYFKLQNFLFMPMNGLGQGSLPITAYNLGAKQYERIRETCKAAITIGVGISMIGIIIFLVFPEQLLMLFSASREMLVIGVPALRIISISFVCASVTMIIGYLISGLGNGMINMIGTALRQIVILLPAVLIFGHFGGIEMIWYSFWISEGCAFLFAIYSLKKKLAD